MTGDLALLIEAAHAAGEIALRYWRKSPEVWEKEQGAGPVSEADLAVDRALNAILTAARPGYGWLSEETPDDRSRLGRQRCFIVDPIDGTRAFLDGTPDFAHSLAVTENGQPVAAVVFLPAQNRLYSAEKGALARLNGAPISVSGRAGVEGASLLTARASMDTGHWCNGVPPVTRAFRSSLAWRLCLVAEGAFDAMLTLRPTWDWDAAAGALIAAQAGARVSDRTGREFSFNQPDPRQNGCIAGAPGVHAGLLSHLRA